MTSPLPIPYPPRNLARGASKVSNERQEILGELLEEISDLEERSRAMLARAEALKLAYDTLARRARQPSFALSGKSLGEMTIREGLQTILYEEGKPLHTTELLSRLEAGGKHATMNALRGLLYGKDNKGSFKKIGPGMWTLGRPGESNGNGE